MPDFILFFRLILSTFILKKKSLHYPSRKRILAILFVAPILLVIIFLNQLFLLLDNLFFFPFRWIKIEKSTFITGVPRSGTTYMYELLSLDNHFTSFKLWEIIFAPSIIQKLIAVLVIKIDYVIGRPLYKFSKRIEQKAIGDFQHIHPLSLSMPEEDEPLMIYDFSSLYLYYFFPEAKAIKPYLFFDEALPAKKRKRIMNFYYRCVQRHQFVFNPKGDKIFLSKNPAFVSKISSLNQRFPNCKIIYMLRSPMQTIPSTISLNEHIFSLFSKVEPDADRVEESREIIIKWYKMSQKALLNLTPSSHKTVLFKNFIADPTKVLKNLYILIKLSPASTPNKNQQALIEEKRSYTSKHNYDYKKGILNIEEDELLKELGLFEFKGKI